MRQRLILRNYLGLDVLVVGNTSPVMSERGPPLEYLVADAANVRHLIRMDAPMLTEISPVLEDLFAVSNRTRMHFVKLHIPQSAAQRSRWCKSRVGGSDVVTSSTRKLRTSLLACKNLEERCGLRVGLYMAQ